VKIIKMLLGALTTELLTVVIIALSVLALAIFSAPPTVFAVDANAPRLGPYVTFIAGLVLCFLATRRVVRRSRTDARQRGYLFVGMVCALDVALMLAMKVPLALFMVLSLLGRAGGGYLGANWRIGSASSAATRALLIPSDRLD
jgi:hypothetical protein